MAYKGIGEKEIKTAWPVVQGDTVGTTSQIGQVMNLIPDRDITSQRYRVGLK